MAAAKVANDAAKDITLSELQDSIDEGTDAVDEASKAIKAIDDTAIALMTTLEAIMPGIDTMDGALDLVYGAMDFTEKLIMALSALMGMDNSRGQRTVNEIRKQIEDARIKDVTIYERGPKEYNESMN